MHAAQRLEGPLHQLLASLREHLYRHIRRDAAFINQRPAKTELSLRRGRKANLNLLEAQADQQIEHSVLTFQIHGVNQRLIPIAQVNTAPDRCFADGSIRPGAVIQRDSRSGWVLGYRILQHGVLPHQCERP